MPLIKASFSKSLNKDEIISVKKSLGEIISLFPGKSETYLMVDILDNQNLFLGGDDSKDLALFEVSLLGHAQKRDCEKVTQALCVMSKDLLNIDGDRIYVTFMDYDKWGYNSFMF